jgi:two-component system response regulator DesR
MKIRVVIAEDQSMILGALAALLESEGDIEIVGQARNGAEAMEMVRERKPDLLLTDIEMPIMDGLELAMELKRQRLPTRVIVLTTFARTGYLRRALDSGASGYLLKDSPASQLASAVRRVHSGIKVIAPEFVVEAWNDDDPLTDRERQILRLAEEGRSSPEIAAKLGLSDGTVRNYLSVAISKLGAHNRVDAARIARKKGWI